MNEEERKTTEEFLKKTKHMVEMPSSWFVHFYDSMDNPEDYEVYYKGEKVKNVVGVVLDETHKYYED